MKERNAYLLLLTASFLWGITFVFQNKAADVIEAASFNAIRMMIGFFVLLPFSIRIFNKHKTDKEYLKHLFKSGILLGFVIALASYTQQLGIGMTSAGKAGFITSLYSLFVPVLAAFRGKKTSVRTWCCVFVGLCGAFLLSINKETGLSLGDGLIFLCAILFAIQITIIDEAGKNLEGVDLSALQFFFGSLFSIIIALISKENTSMEIIKQAYVPILYAGIFSCGIAYTLQIVGQKYTHPAKATLVLSLESTWAGIGGALLLKETMNFKEILGCILLFAAVIFSQIPAKSIDNKYKK